MKTFFSSLLIVFATLFAAPAFAALPAGYTELQYIESTGTQYIDTDYIGSATTQVNIDFQLTETAYTILFGTGVADSRTGSNISNYFFANPSGYQWGAYVNGSFTYAGTNTDLNRHKVRYNDGNNYYIDDTLFISNKQPSFNKKIYLFASNGDSAVKPTKAKMYSVQIYNNGTPVRELVPVRRNSDGAIGMYDTVNNRFYTNQGTGEFTPGPVAGIHIATTAYNSARFSPVVTDLNSTIATIRDVVTNTINQTKAIADLQATKQTRPEDACPAGKKCLLVETEENGVIVPHWFPIIENIYGLPTGYTPLEYIQSTGTQYIDTGVVPKTFDYEITTTGSFDITAGGPNAMWGYLTSNGAKTPRWVLATYSGGWLGSANDTRTAAPANTLKHTFVNEVFLLNGTPTSRLYVDGEQVQQVAISIHPETWADNTLSIYLFGRNNNGTFGSAAALKIYRHIVKKNGTVIQDLIPAKNSSGVIGMYDTVNNVFYQNAGTGTFTAGPEM